MNVWGGVSLQHISVAVAFADAHMKRDRSVWHSGYEIWMKGRRDKGLTYCLAIWATDIKKLVILLSMSMTGYTVILIYWNFTWTWQKVPAQLRYRFCFLFFWVSENKRTELCCFRMQMYYSHQILLPNLEVKLWQAIILVLYPDNFCMVL